MRASKILAIDPGTTESAVVIWDGTKVLQAHILPNERLREQLCFAGGDYTFAIEMVACYGMAVGKEVFQTCVWIGRFAERCANEPLMIFRQQVKLHLCQSPRAKDANVRQAILDKFGGKDAALGRKSAPGPLYGVKSHLWAALAIALYVQDMHNP